MRGSFTALNPALNCENWTKSYKLNPPRMFNILWTDKIAKELAQMNRRDLRVVNQILTGHAALNYNLSRVNRAVERICQLCEAEEETVSHLLGQLGDKNYV